jgi:hypothetical protein
MTWRSKTPQQLQEISQKRKNTLLKRTPEDILRTKQKRQLFSITHPVEEKERISKGIKTKIIQGNYKIYTFKNLQTNEEKRLTPSQFLKLIRTYTSGSKCCVRKLIIGYLNEYKNWKIINRTKQDFINAESNFILAVEHKKQKEIKKQHKKRIPWKLKTQEEKNKITEKRNKAKEKNWAAIYAKSSNTKKRKSIEEKAIIANKQREAWKRKTEEEIVDIINRRKQTWQNNPLSEKERVKKMFNTKVALGIYNLFSFKNITTNEIIKLSPSQFRKHIGVSHNMYIWKLINGETPELNGWIYIK